MALFASCAQDSALFEVAQEAATRLNASGMARIVVGEPQPCEELLRIYTARLTRKNERNERVAGLVETVQSFAKCEGQLQGGYAGTDRGLIYFWTDDAGTLAGCVLELHIRNERTND